MILLIITLVLINLYYKRNVYNSMIFGLVLTSGYLVIKYNFIFDGALEFISLENYLEIVLFFIMLYVFRILFDLFEKSHNIRVIQNIFSNIFNDMDKLFILLLLGSFFFKAPFVGIIFLIFAGLLFRIPKLYAVEMASISVLFFLLYNNIYFTENINYILTRSSHQQLNIIFTIIFYAFGFLFVVVNDCIKNKTQTNIYVIKAIYSSGMVLLNIFISTIISSFVEFIYTLPISILVTIITYSWIVEKVNNYLHAIEIPHIKREITGKSFNKIHLPYLFFTIIFILEALGYFMLDLNAVYGELFLIILNLMLIKLFYKSPKQKQVNEFSKLAIICILVILNLVIITQIFSLNSIDVATYLRDSELSLNNIGYVILYSQIYVLFPIFDAFRNFGLNIASEFVGFKMILLIQVQMILSFYTLLIAKAVFKISSGEIVDLIVAFGLISIIMQIIIYIL